MFSLTRLRNRLFYGWIVVAACFAATGILIGIRMSFGVFFKSIEYQFDLSRTETSAVTSLASLLTGMFAIIVGWASDRYGPKIVLLVMGLLAGLGLLLTSQTNSVWQLFITYSLLLSMGFGGSFPVIMSTVSRWFDKKRGLAMGITTAGAGLGTMLIAPFATYLIDSFDWRISFIVLGILAWLTVVPISQLLKKEPSEIGAFPDGVTPVPEDIGFQKEGINPMGLSLLQAFRTMNFWLMVFLWVAFSSCSFMVMTHLVPHVTDIGFTAGQAASVLSLLGGTTTVGRVLGGFASDKIGRRSTTMLCTSIMACCMMLLFWSHELWTLYLFAIFFGFSFGGIGSSTGTLVGDIFGLSGIGMILGGLAFAFGIGSAAGPVLGGFVFDVTLNYSVAFLIEAAIMVIATLLTALIRLKSEFISHATPHT